MKNFNILENIVKKVLTDNLAKTSQNIFAYSFISEHTYIVHIESAYFEYNLRKNLHFLANASAKNAIFFACSLREGFNKKKISWQPVSLFDERNGDYKRAKVSIRISHKLGFTFNLKQV